MLPHGGKVIAAVSGGADSMCMLHILLDLRDEYGYELIAAHFNHMLRGEESDADERFVLSACEKIGVPVFTGRGDVAAYAKENGMGTEEAARALRYGFFESLAEETGAVCVATAHTADDNLETVLMNLTRGAGLSGLCGIPPVRGIYIRPLLNMSRADVEKYLAERGIEHVEDKTNNLDIYTRNRIRHQVAPVLRSLNEDVSGAVADMTELLRRDEDFLAGEAERFIRENFRENRVDRRLLAGLHGAVSSRVVRIMCQSAERKHVESILDLCGDEVLPSAHIDIPGMTVFREYDDIVFGEDETIRPFEPFFIEPGDIVQINEPGLEVSCEKTVLDGKIDKNFTVFVFKSSDICGKICVRSRKSGDSIRLSDKAGTKTLKKLFIEKKIPARLRDTIPVLADTDRVLAVYGVGQDVSFAAEPGDEVLKIRFREIV